MTDEGNDKGPEVNFGQLAKNRLPERVSEMSLNVGPGLFTDEIDVGLARECLAALKHLSTSSISSRNETGVLKALVNIVRHYRTDKLFDDRVRWSDLKREVTPLINPLKKIRVSLQGLSAAARTAVCSNAEEHHWNRRVNQVEEALDVLAYIEKGVLSISRQRNHKIRRCACENACKSLAELRTRLSGRRFAKTVQTDPQNQEFVSPDAHFILTAMRAIDPGVTLAQVRTAIRKRVRSGQNQKRTEALI